MAAKKSGTAKKSSSKAKTQTDAGKKQLIAVILFAAAVFFLCVVFIKGQNVWEWMHNAVFGIFGITAYFYPFLLGFIAVVLAMDKVSNSIIAKAVEVSVLVILISAAVDIFSAHNPDFSFIEHITNADGSGTHLKSGGFIGAPIAYLLTIAFEPVISLILLFIILAVVILFAIGITPDYIITQIRIRRQMREENIDFDDEYDAKKIEALKQKELERMSKSDSKIERRIE